MPLVLALHRAGRSLREIALALTAAGYRTRQGGCLWSAVQVSRVLRRALREVVARQEEEYAAEERPPAGCQTLVAPPAAGVQVVLQQTAPQMPPEKAVVTAVPAPVVTAAPTPRPYDAPLVGVAVRALTPREAELVRLVATSRYPHLR